MRILIDLIHPADVNFYKNAVAELEKQGHKITFTVLRRGRLSDIAAHEFPGYERIVFGTHRKSFLGKLWSIFSRECGFLFLYLRRKFDVVTGFGFYSGMLARPLGMRAVHFHDDKEYKKNFLMTRLFSSKFISLCSTKLDKKTRIVNSYKELAYLAPRWFHEDMTTLKKMKLRSLTYVYVRDVANISLNYASNKLFDYQPFFSLLHKKGYKIIYDCESDGSYPDTLKLPFPLTSEQMNAIKKHAALVITSGDTVLREAALLGTPCVYTSTRNMAVNEKLLRDGLFKKALSSEELTRIGLDLLRPGLRSKLAKRASHHVKSRADMTQTIVEELLG